MNVESRTKFRAEYVLNGKVVGWRDFFPTGEVEFEVPLKNGRTHGTMYGWDKPGRLSFAEPFRDGCEHGTAKQWSEDGELLGTYTMNRGTGIDLWWNDDRRGIFLAEARYYKNGKLDGSEWWINRDRKSVREETHFRASKKHGIERSWNYNGKLRRGYPKYWLNDERVTKRQYVRACAKDQSLPLFRERDNRPYRKFPAAVEMAMRRRTLRSRTSK